MLAMLWCAALRCNALRCAALRCDVLGGSVDGELWRELAVENQADVNNASTRDVQSALFSIMSASYKVSMSLIQKEAFVLEAIAGAKVVAFSKTY